MGGGGEEKGREKGRVIEKEESNKDIQCRFILW